MAPDSKGARASSKDLFGLGAANQAAMQANMERATSLGKLEAFENAMERQRIADMFAMIEEGAPVYRVS